MKVSRRSFLGIAALTAGGVAAAIALAQPQLKRLFQRQSAGEAGNPFDPGQLSEDVLALLLATTQAVIALPVELEPYANYFQATAENLPFYKALYEDFSQRLTETAQRAGHDNFLDLEPQEQLQIIGDLCPWENLAVRATDLGFTEEELTYCELYERYLIGKVLTLFSQTDSWLILGYNAAPGTPRGLESYTNLPVG